VTTEATAAVAISQADTQGTRKDQSDSFCKVK